MLLASIGVSRSLTSSPGYGTKVPLRYPSLKSLVVSPWSDFALDYAPTIDDTVSMETLFIVLLFVHAFLGVAGLIVAFWPERKSRA